MGDENSGVIKPRIVTITASGISPPVMKIQAGQDVTWVNSDLVPHTISVVTGAIGSGQSAQQTFPTPGEYTYHLDNGGITGTVVVENPSNS